METSASLQRRKNYDFEVLLICHDNDCTQLWGGKSKAAAVVRRVEKTQMYNSSLLVSVKYTIKAEIDASWHS